MMQSPNQTTKSKLNHKFQTVQQTVKDVKQVQGYSKLSKKKIWKDIKDTKVQEAVKRRDKKCRESMLCKQHNSFHHFPKVALSEKYKA